MANGILHSFTDSFLRCAVRILIAELIGFSFRFFIFKLSILQSGQVYLFNRHNLWIFNHYWFIRLVRIIHSLKCFIINFINNVLMNLNSFFLFSLVSSHFPFFFGHPLLFENLLRKNCWRFFYADIDFTVWFFYCFCSFCFLVNELGFWCDHWLRRQ